MKHVFLTITCADDVVKAVEDDAHAAAMMIGSKRPGIINATVTVKDSVED